MLLLLLACHHHNSTLSLDTSGPIGAHFNASIVLPGQRGPVSGQVVLSLPDRFYVDVRPPVGGPALIAACDGKEVTAWIAGKQQFWQIPVERLQEVVPLGISGPAAAVDLLLGRLPNLGEPFKTEGSSRYWMAPGDTSLVATLAENGQLGSLQSLAPQDGVPLGILSWSWNGAWPAGMELQLPTQGVQLSLHYDDFAAMTVPDSLFHLNPPAGATIKSLDDLHSPL